MAKIETASVKRTKPGTYLVMGCVHVPFENKRFLQSVYKFIAAEGIKLQGVVLAGDVLDMNSLSGHDKGKSPITGITLGKEYKAGAAFVSDIDSLPYSKGASKDFIWGNHCDRYFREMRLVDMGKIADVIPRPEEGMKMGLEWTVHEDWQQDYVTLGEHLDVMHGSYCNVHTAKKHLDTLRTSVLYHHTHRYQVYVEGMHGAFNMGWAGDVDAPAFGYATRMMKKSWFNNITLVHIDKEGYYIIQPIPWINGKLVVNGRRY